MQIQTDCLVFQIKWLQEKIKQNKHSQKNENKQEKNKKGVFEIKVF